MKSNNKGHKLNNKENKVHKLKADVFYVRKIQAKCKSRKSESLESLTMDFQKNLPTPNISTIIVYYKRQLSMYSFNIHILSYNDIVLYAYPDTVGSKRFK